MSIGFRSPRGEVTAVHVPVLLQATLEGLGVQPGGRYIDATVGGGGHAAGILATSAPEGLLLGLDRDPAALDAARRRLAVFGGRVVLAHGSFADLAEIGTAHGFGVVDGVLFDLGLSSLQLADPTRGFAFGHDGPLDMRFDPTAGGPTAADLVNELSTEELSDLLYRYGEERQSRRIAEAIAAARPLHTTCELAAVVEEAVGRRPSTRFRQAQPSGSGWGRRIHPATRTFQALRIAVNDELGALARALPQAVELLVPGGRLVVVSFHSLEDRLVKRFLRDEARDRLCPPEVPTCVCGHRATLRVLTRSPVRPGPDEVAENPRSRSARLRVAERLASDST